MTAKALGPTRRPDAGENANLQAEIDMVLRVQRADGDDRLVDGIVRCQGATARRLQIAPVNVDHEAPE